MTKWVRNLIGVLMAFALLSALWSTALARVSEQQTAVTFLTDTGTELINPLLVANGSGLAQGGYQQLEQVATAHPTQPLQVAFIKAPFTGQDIAGKNFNDGTRVIYSHMAEVFYANGPQAAFNLPPQLQSFINSYSPFIASKNAAASALPKLPIPQIPAFVAPLFTHIGITPTTLTADGHKAYQTEMLIFWTITLILAAILALTSRGWDRLKHIAWPVFHASWFISLVGIIGTVLVSLHPVQAAPYQGILDIVGTAFFRVFYIATAVGIAGIVVGLVGPRLVPVMSTAHDEAPARAARPDAARPQPYTPLRSGTTLPNDNRGTTDRAPYRYKDAPSFPSAARGNDGGRGAPGYRAGPAQPGAIPGTDRWASPRQDFPPSQARWPNLGQDAPSQSNPPEQAPWSNPPQGNPPTQDPWAQPQPGYPPAQVPWSNPQPNYPPEQDPWSNQPPSYPAPQAPWANPQPGNPPTQAPWADPTPGGYPPAPNYPPTQGGPPDPRQRYRPAPERQPDGPENYPPTQDSWTNSR